MYYFLIWYIGRRAFGMRTYQHSNHFRDSWQTINSSRKSHQSCLWLLRRLHRLRKTNFRNHSTTRCLPSCLSICWCSRGNKCVACESLLAPTNLQQPLAAGKPIGCSRYGISRREHICIYTFIDNWFIIFVSLSYIYIQMCFYTSVHWIGTLALGPGRWLGAGTLWVMQHVYNI